MGLYRATLHATQSGQTVDVITGWKTSGATNSGDADIIADRVYQGFSSTFGSHQVDDLNYVSCDVIGVDDTTVGGFFSGSAAGQLNVQPAPLFVVARVKLTTGLRGRSYQGRFGIPGLPADAPDLTDGNLLAGYYAGVYATDLSNFISHVETGPPSPVLAVISTVHNKAPRVPPIGTPVTTAAVQNQLGSRVSRKD